MVEVAALCLLGAGCSVGLGLPLPIYMLMQKRQKLRSAQLTGLVSSSQDDRELVSLVVAHVHHASLDTKLVGKRVAVQIDYGKASLRHASCSTGPAVVEQKRDLASKFVARSSGPCSGLLKREAKPATADFEQACVFLADDHCEPVVQLRLVQGRTRRVIATAEVWIPSQESLTQHSRVVLRARDSTVVGELSVTLGLRAVCLGEVRKGLAHELCEFQGQAIVAGTVPLHVGRVVPAEVDLKKGDIVREGEPVRRGVFRSASSGDLNRMEHDDGLPLRHTATI
mmetsp:Transcript_55787/g.146754  ORF Transcript_55787/g.146754 Transcript_55787/m.146754 type:complete len:283 (-) Transcript_55787:57-905(-)